MNGARKFARDYVEKFAKPGTRLFDIACGDEWVKREFPDLDYLGVDITKGQDLTTQKAWEGDLGVGGFAPDVIISIYGICTLLHEEARAWTMMRRIAKPYTRLIYVGRYKRNPGREMGRSDPINGYNRDAVVGLALASGWRVVDFKAAFYDGEFHKVLPPDYEILMDANPNAFAATLEPIL